MVVTIHKSHRGWTFAGNGPGVRVRLPKGAEWLHVKTVGDVLFVPTVPGFRAAWDAGRVAREVEAGNLKVVAGRKKYACAKEVR